MLTFSLFRIVAHQTIQGTTVCYKFELLKIIGLLHPITLSVIQIILIQLKIYLKETIILLIFYVYSFWTGTPLIIWFGNCTL